MTRLLLFVAWFALPFADHSQNLSGLIEDLESRTQFGLFTDFQAEFNDEDQHAQFYTGHLVGHITTTLSPRLQYFAEISLSPELDHPRAVVLALTADATLITQKRCEDSGMQGFITKPFTPASLIEGIRVVLDRAVDQGEVTASGVSSRRA